MKKILIAMLAACCVWAAWDATRPVDNYVVKTAIRSGIWWAL